MWWALGNEGFHPGNNAAKNDNLREELVERMEVFLQNGVRWDYSIVRPNWILDHYFGPSRPRTRSFSRKDPVTLEKVNYLALIAGLYMLKQYFRGLPTQGGLEALKKEVYFLLTEFGYHLQPERIVLCPVQANWSEQEALWLFVQNFQAQEMLYEKAPGLPEFSNKICAECPIMCRVVQ
ncbi:MAG: hypothetical protein V4465_01600 [Patescibacteria group bacterium]